MELAPQDGGSDRYKKIHYDAAAIDSLLVKLFLEAYRETPEQIVIDLDATDLPVHGHQEQRFFHGFYNHYCYLPLYIVCGIICSASDSDRPTLMPAPVRSKRSSALSNRSGKGGRK